MSAITTDAHVLCIIFPLAGHTGFEVIVWT